MGWLQNVLLTQDWRDQNRIPDSDAVEELKEELKRDRSESTVSGGSITSSYSFRDPEYLTQLTT
jgi:hypothetical protein